MDGEEERGVARRDIEEKGGEQTGGVIEQRNRRCRLRWIYSVPVSLIMLAHLHTHTLAVIALPVAEYALVLMTVVELQMSYTACSCFGGLLARLLSILLHFSNLKKSGILKAETCFWVCFAPQIKELLSVCWGEKSNTGRLSFMFFFFSKHMQRHICILCWQRTHLINSRQVHKHTAAG